MGALYQSMMPEYELYYWPFLPKEMLENAKEDRHQKTDLRGVGAEMATVGDAAAGKTQAMFPQHWPASSFRNTW